MWSAEAAVVPVQIAVLVVLAAAGVALLARAAQRHATRTGQPPVRSALVFASGADADLLRERAPSDQNHYAALGGSVLITACLAAISLTVALTVAFSASNRWWIAYLPFAVLYGLAIFWLDRQLVMMQLNPYRFVTEPQTITESPSAPVGPRSVLRTVALAIPRILLSVVISLIIAEPILLSVFDDEIQVRIEQIHQESARAAEEQVDRSYAAQIADLEAALPASVELDETEAEIEDLQAEIDEADARAADNREQADAEKEGDRYSVDGQETTGRSGCGEQCRTYQRKARRQERLADQLRSRKRQLVETSETLVEEIGSTEDDRRAQLNELRDVVIPREKREARQQAEQSSGLLLRIKALEQLSVDRDPFSENDTEDPGSDESEFSTQETGFLGLTTLGLTIWVVRLWLVLLDALPVLLKVMLSLRSRRPYDVAVARTQEEQIAADTVEVSRIRASSAWDISAAAQDTNLIPPQHSRLVIRYPDGQQSVLEPGDEVWVDSRGFPVGPGSAARARMHYSPSIGWVVTPTDEAAQEDSRD